MEFVKIGRVNAEAILRRIAENSQDIIYHYALKPAFSCLYINPVIEKLVGFSPQDFYNEPRLFLRAVYPGDRHFFQARFFSAQINWPVEMRLVRRDGTLLWTEQYFERILDSDGQVVAVEGMAHDVTERKRIQLELLDTHAQLELRVQRRTGELLEINDKLQEEIEERQRMEAALSESERQKKALLDNILDLAWLKDVSGRFIAVNEPFGRACGFKPEDLAGKNDLDIWPWELAMSYRQDDREVMTTCQPKRVEEPILGPDGRVWWAETIRTPIFDDQGTVIGTVGIARDVTERKQSEEVLRDGLSRLDQLVKARTSDLEVANQELIAEIAVRTQRERELESMVSTVAALRVATTRTEMEEAVADQLVEMLQVDTVALAMCNAITNEVVFETVRGSYTAWYGLTQPCDVGIIGYVISTGNAYFTQDLPHDQLLHQRDLAKKLKGAACLPLKAQARVIGVLWVASENRLDPNTQRFLLAVGDVVASSLYRATLYEQTQQNAAQLAKVANIGSALVEILDLTQLYAMLAQAAFNLLNNTHAVTIALYDSQHNTVTSVYAVENDVVVDVSHAQPLPVEPPGMGLRSEVIRQRQAMIFNDTQDLARKIGSNLEINAVPAKTRSVMAVPLLAKGDMLGVLQVDSRLVNRFSQSDADLLRLVCNSAAAAVQNARLFGYLEISNQELVHAYDATIEGWSSALELHDRDTAGHSQRVTELTMRLAKAMGIPPAELANIRRGALLHDIGKMGLPDSILTKTGPLDINERIAMDRHPDLARQLLEHIDYLRPAIDIPYLHHERWDGSGYPRHMKGEEIPMAARIFAVVDVYDALLSDRSYRAAWRHSDVLHYIKEKSGIYFDPKVVEAFLRIV